MPRRHASARAMLRAFRAIHGDRPDPSFMADLDFAQKKDLDLSVRIGALLAFNALLISTGINPLTASPGAPVSLDAARQPWEVAAIALGVVLLSASALLCVRAIMLGEEFSPEGLEENSEALAQRLLAAYVTSIDAESRLAAIAARLTIAGGAVTLLGCGWILLAKIF